MTSAGRLALLTTPRQASAPIRNPRVEYFTVDYWTQNWLEATGLVSGLLCVALLIRQNIWNWPIGMLYSLVSMVVFYRERLYAELPLQLFYVVMNGYGWYYWTFARTKTPRSEEELPVTNIPMQTAAALALIVAVVTAATGFFYATQTSAAYPYWDSAATTMSFAGMWMTARKQIENWYVWLVVDVLETGIYLAKGIELYAVLYCVYVGMAIAGWWAWYRSMQQTATA
jgi:nicotinamide mononucleotide transporter